MTLDDRTNLQDLKELFIERALRADVLRFGSFTLKSGRVSPYFFNMGLFYKACDLHYIGRFYAQTLINNNIDCAHLFGPAYKGIPLATATALALSEMDVSTTVTFNRKEIKDHGEGGTLIGAPLLGNTIVIDDVITAGTAFREAQQQIVQAGGTLTTVIVGLDRAEKGLGEISALDEIRSENITVLSLISFADLIAYLEKIQSINEINLMVEYQEKYGSKS